MTGKKGKLLLVDDESVILKILKNMLEDSADSIDSAGNGRLALETMESDAYDAIVTDISMPQMTGLQMLAEMRLREIDIPVIILSSYSDKDNILQALRLGAVDFLEKPVDPDRLSKSVRNALELGMAFKNRVHELDEIVRINKLSPEVGQRIKNSASRIREIRKAMQLPL